MFNESIIYLILAAYSLDMVLGDPRWLNPIHLIVLMGRAISFFEPRFRRLIKSEFISGVIFALFLIALAWLAAFTLIRLFAIVHPYFGTVIQVILLFFCLSARTLEQAASEVKDALTNQGLEAGRLKVSMIVGREVKYLDETGVIKATVESVAENFVDGFLSPILFAVVGGTPAAVAYKMVNTLDSMVGYKNDKYLLFGRASARIDDAANFIPARVSVIIISIAAAILSAKRGVSALNTAIKEGKDHKSPNSGYSEAAFAGALRVKLGGPNYYHGTLVDKPYIGKNFANPEKKTIEMSCDLMLLSSVVAVVGIVIFYLIFFI
ncbi:MAG: cobalamin biosynthesis protein CobD [Desulfamplus sp.]|nr:cobalamin biosynthesis protein CobD [Desulfamplus sp.]